MGKSRIKQTTAGKKVDLKSAIGLWIRPGKLGIRTYKVIQDRQKEIGVDLKDATKISTKEITPELIELCEEIVKNGIYEHNFDLGENDEVVVSSKITEEHMSDIISNVDLTMEIVSIVMEENRPLAQKKDSTS